MLYEKRGVFHEMNSLHTVEPFKHKITLVNIIIVVENMQPTLAKSDVRCN